MLNVTLCVFVLRWVIGETDIPDYNQQNAGKFWVWWTECIRFVHNATGI